MALKESCSLKTLFAQNPTFFARCSGKEKNIGADKCSPAHGEEQDQIFQWLHTSGCSGPSGICRARLSCVRAGQGCEGALPQLSGDAKTAPRAQGELSCHTLTPGALSRALGVCTSQLTAQRRCPEGVQQQIDGKGGDLLLELGSIWV